jgi:UDP-N-acetylglucosamine--N-acetylmuramyl-(pentapeptide) pyrophosphoryl-undecaprenol N-acetylglucosamine transferase
VKILVVAGPSGGHIFPALSFLDTLKEKYKHTEMLLILPRKIMIDEACILGNKVKYISSSSIRLSISFINFLSILKFFKGSLESIFILMEFKPDIVVGFGGLVSIPMVMLAYLFRLKTLIHEQNVIPGRANRFLARFADRIAISFSRTKDYFKDYSKKIVLTGNPLRKELVRIDKNKALDFFGFSNDKLTVLVIGGSQGSYPINMGFFRAVSALSDKHNLQIIHLTGRKDYDLLKHKYKELNISVRVFSFLNSMEYAYSACDIVLSRAGATTLTEIIYFKLPAIIVPYGYAYRHQMENAKILENIGSAILLEDDKLNTGILKDIIEDFINNPNKLKEISSYYDLIPRLNVNDLLLEAALSFN